METKLITEILTEKNIKPSFARIQIYNYLGEFKSHPTVDEIYLHLIDTIPTLSKTTVYNALNLFEEEGLVYSLNIDNGEKRYEIKDHDHIHFKCTSCNKIYDIPYIEKNILPEEYKNFIIEERQISLKGICEKCRD